MVYFLSLSKSDALLALHASETILLFFGILLAIGIMGEYRDPLRARLVPDHVEAGKSRKKKKSYKWAVIIGVVGEFWGESGIYLSSRQIEAIDGASLKDKDVQIAALQKAVRPRILDSKAFVAFLRGKSKERVEILYKRDDDEAYGLALQIRRWLGPGSNGDGVDWPVDELRPLSESDALGGKWSPPKAPLSTNAGAWFGLGLVVKQAPYPPFGNENTPVWALSFALQNAGVGGGQVMMNPKFSNDLIRIVVGPKMY